MRAIALSIALLLLACGAFRPPSPPEGVVYRVPWGAVELETWTPGDDAAATAVVRESIRRRISAQADREDGEPLQMEPPYGGTYSRMHVDGGIRQTIPSTSDPAELLRYLDPRWSLGALEARPAYREELED